MRLVDIDNIDYVILEDSLHKIEHKKGDEIDCVIGAEIVPAIPLEKIKQARQEIELNAYPIVHRINNHDMGMTLTGIFQVLDELIEQYIPEEKREEKEEAKFKNTLYDFKNSDNVQDENDSLHFNEEELQDICMTCLYAYELIHDDGYTREEIENKLSFDKYLFFALKYIDNHLSISEVIEKYAKEYFALKDNQSIQQQSENEEELER